jgi:hypothetical protein
VISGSLAFLFLLSSTAFAGWSTSGPTGGPMNAVVVAPSDSNVIWAGDAAGVFRSTDGGATWADVSGPVADVHRRPSGAVVHFVFPNHGVWEFQ